MVIREEYMTRKDGVKLFRNYSDEGKRIVQNETGIVYDEAVDVENAPYTYSEYEEPHAGTPEDPIPYTSGMELESGRYYTQDGITYLCVKDAAPADVELKDLLGICLILA